jgi:hypothetical protein
MKKALALTVAVVLVLSGALGAAAALVPPALAGAHPGQVLVLVAVLLACLGGALAGALGH